MRRSTDDAWAVALSFRVNSQFAALALIKSGRVFSPCVHGLGDIHSWLNVSRYLAGETSEGNPSFRRFWVTKNDYDYNTRSLISSMLREPK